MELQVSYLTNGHITFPLNTRPSYLIMKCGWMCNVRIFFYVTVDIDECRERPDVCQPGRCRNTQGGYRCDCPRGYRPSTDGKHCVGNELFCLL